MTPVQKEVYLISGGHALQWKKNLAFYSTSLTEDHLFPHRALWQIGSDMLELKTL